MNTEKLNIAVLAQGWIGGRLEEISSAFSKNPDADVQQLATQLLENWAIVDGAMDELIRENTDLRNKLALAKSALGFDELKAQIAKLNNIE